MTERRFQKAGSTCGGRLQAGFILVWMLFITGPVCAPADNQRAEVEAAPSPLPFQKTEVFLAAQNAYDEGRYEEAVTLYGQLVSNGVDNVEVHYNLANASFKTENLADAVLHYRRAWVKAPRDPDIQTNLRFALNAAGAAEPAPAFAERVFYMTSAGGWMTTAAAAYGVLSLLLLLGMLIRRFRRTLLRLSLLPAAVMLLSAGGWWQWRQFDFHPEWVVVKTGATALFGPIEGATAHYKVPLAALVRQHDIDPKGWIEIEYDGKKGWLKEEYITRVSP